MKLKDLLKEEEGLNPSEKFGLKEVGEQIVQAHKRLNELLFKYMGGVKKYASKHRNNPELSKKLNDLYTHIKGNYYYTTKQAAGRYMLPFEKQYKSLVSEGVSEGKLTEAVGQYAVNVQDTRKNKQIQSGHFTLKDDAKLYIKDMMKKHKLKRQKGFWGNPKTGVEMLTNF